MAELRLEGVSRRYGEVGAVDNVSISVASGQFLTLLGPSGCGKSTTLRIIAGLVAPSEGRVLIDGVDVTALGAAKRKIGMVFQSLALFPHMTAAENVAFGLQMRQVPPAERAKRVQRMLELVALGPLADRYPAQMSGGQQQRVALARALVIEPSILILDEPFGALDRKLRESMQIELYRITRDLRTTAIFVTHDQEEALTLSDRVAVMHEGRIEQLGTPAEIFCEPRTRFVADFMGATNFFEGPVLKNGDAYVVEVCGASVPLPARSTLRPGDLVSVAIRPERIVLAPTGPDSRDALRGYIRQANYHGDTSSYVVELRDTTVVVRDRNGTDGHAMYRFAVGSAVAVSWPPEAVHVLPNTV